MLGLFDHYLAGGAIRLDDIERVGESSVNRHGAIVRMLHLREGAPIRLIGEVPDLFLRPVQIMPCESGLKTIVCYVEDHDGEPKAVPWRSIMTGWALCLDGQVRPLTAAGVNDGRAAGNDIFVEFPCGRIAGVGETDPVEFDDARAMIAHFQEDAVRRRALNEARNAAVKTPVPGEDAQDD